MEGKRLLITLISSAAILSACGGVKEEELPLSDMPPPEQRGFEVLEYDLRDPITKQSLWTGYYCAPQVRTERFYAVREDLYDIVYRPLRHYVLVAGQKFEVYVKVKTNTKDTVYIRMHIRGASFDIQPGITEISYVCELKKVAYNEMRITCDNGISDSRRYKIDDTGPINPPLMLEGNDGKTHAVISAEDLLPNIGLSMVTNRPLLTYIDVTKPDLRNLHYVAIPEGITYKNSISVNIRFHPVENNRNTCPPYFQPIGKW